MLRKYRHWKRKRAINKVKPGDGHPLKEYRWWQIFTRSVFYMRIVEEDIENVYAVNVDYFNEDETTELYLNGKHHATSNLPATFPVANGYIEVATTTFGLKRMHYVTADGTEQQLAPHPRSMEGLRMKFDQRFPGISKLIGIAAIIILLVSLVLGLPQLVALISQIDFISDRFGTFESPIVLSDWLNMTLVVGGTLAALERAITLRSHWLIDMETWWDD